MKSLFSHFLFPGCLALFLATAHSTAFATVRTVSNNSLIPAQYATPQAAADAANNGDTLYIAGSPNLYNGGLKLNKRLTVIGNGYNPSYPEFSTRLQYIQIDTVVGVSGPSGSKIMGLEVWQIYNHTFYYSSNGFRNLVIDRCYLSKQLDFLSQPNLYQNFFRVFDNTIIRNCVIKNAIEITNETNILIENNIFHNSKIIGNSSSCIIKNNIFIASNHLQNQGHNSSGYCFSYWPNQAYVLQYAVITNNIFWGTSPNSFSLSPSFGASNCAFNNNLVFQSPNDVVPGFGINVGSGNFDGVDPQFTNATNPAGSGVNLNNDYHLKSTSPGKNAGTDGKDIGIYGGASPFPDNTGLPKIPIITELNIINSTIGQGNNLNVTLKGRKAK